MWVDSMRVAVIGFSVVFITLLLLAFSVKIMSFVCRRIEKKGGK
jgi:Na+-transporting methylmalonyl-CoA/oxaloacetate decarboxylase gamma subunit